MVKCFEEVVLNKTVDFNINEVCCVSIGSVFGLCYILGYTYDELYTEIMNVDFNELKSDKKKIILTKHLKTSNDLIGFSPTFNLYNLGYKFLIFSKKSKSYLNKIKKISGLILLITGILIVIG